MVLRVSRKPARGSHGVGQPVSHAALGSDDRGVDQRVSFPITACRIPQLFDLGQPENRLHQETVIRSGSTSVAHPIRQVKRRICLFIDP